MQRLVFRASKPLLTEAAQVAANPTCTAKNLNAANAAKNMFIGMNGHKAFVLTAAATGVCLPLSIALANTSVAIAPDLVVATTLPFHMYYGTTLVMQDYVPKSILPGVTKPWAVLCVFAAFGLVRLANEHGIGKTIRHIWAPAPQKGKRHD